MSERNAAVWIDHEEAHVFRVGAEGVESWTIGAPQHVRRHPKREAQPHNHPDDERRFFAEVVESLKGAEALLIVGPSTAKLHFRDFVQAQHATPRLEVVAVETIDHPTDKQLVAYVKHYFASADHSRGRIA